MQPTSVDSRALRLMLAVAALPTALTVAVEVLGLAYPSNVVRALSALPLGAAGAWVLVATLGSEATRA